MTLLSADHSSLGKRPDKKPVPLDADSWIPINSRMRMQMRVRMQLETGIMGVRYSITYPANPWWIPARGTSLTFPRHDAGRDVIAG